MYESLSAKSDAKLYLYNISNKACDELLPPPVVIINQKQSVLSQVY